MTSEPGNLYWIGGDEDPVLGFEGYGVAWTSAPTDRRREKETPNGGGRGFFLKSYIKGKVVSEKYWIAIQLKGFYAKYWIAG